MNTLPELQHRVFCPECGCMRVRTGRYMVCLNGHGKLFRRFTKAEAKRATLGKLPEAARIDKKHFTIKGHEGLWIWTDGAGSRRAKPGDRIQDNQVIARYMPGEAMWVRVFTQVIKEPGK